MPLPILASPLVVSVPFRPVPKVTLLPLVSIVAMTPVGICAIWPEMSWVLPLAYWSVPPWNVSVFVPAPEPNEPLLKRSVPA